MKKPRFYIKIENKNSEDKVINYETSYYNKKACQEIISMIYRFREAFNLKVLKYTLNKISFISNATKSNYTMIIKSQNDITE